MELWINLYIILCGLLRFSDEGLHEQIIQGKYSRRDFKRCSVSSNPIDLMTSLTTVNPKQRLAACKTVAHPRLCFGIESPLLHHHNHFEAKPKKHSQCFLNNHNNIHTCPPYAISHDQSHVLDIKPHQQNKDPSKLTRFSQTHSVSFVIHYKHHDVKHFT